jgi:hypothetical protein
MAFDRLSTGAGAASGPPEFKVPPSSGWSSIRFFMTMPRSRVDPGGTCSASPKCGAPDTGLLRFTHPCGAALRAGDLAPLGAPYCYWISSHDSFLRGCINLQILAKDPVAWSFPCLRFVEIVSPSFHPSVTRSTSSFMLFTRCLPRFFNGLADFNARHGNRYGLGFTVSGLSPDKKRLA